MKYNHKKRVVDMKYLRYAFLSLITFCFLFIFGTDIKAQNISEVDDPEYWSAQGYVDDAFYGDLVERVFQKNASVTSPGRGEYTLRKGIDVSKWQGDIDWEKAKNEGVEFAIIRVGYRGSSTGVLAEDEKYIQNIEGALANDIRVGVYIFSQAITEEEAIEEANYVLSRVYKYNITLPIVIDYEYRSGKDGLEGRLYDALLSKEQATVVCNAFCETVEAAGYTGMVYANKSMLTSQLNAEELADNYRIWLAHYTSETNYKGTYDFWQYSSTGDGYSHGMESQYLDMNWWYDDGKIYGKDYSGVFDANYYANTYADLKEEHGYDAAKLLMHFIQFGMEEGRRGNIEFHVQSYKNYYADLREAFGDDWKKYYQHYLQYGKKEGRITSGYEYTLVDAITTYNGVDYADVYNFMDYVTYNPDVLQEYGYDENAVLAHFVHFGMDEGRQASKDFDVHTYRERYTDLQNVFGTDLKEYYTHYMKYGVDEDRSGVSFGTYYEAVFDAEYYLNHYNNMDLKAALGSDEQTALYHFMNFGMTEGRQASEEFYVHAYKSRYEDLQKAFGDDLEKYYIHYIEFGKNEGRVGF